MSDFISRAAAIEAINSIARTDNWKAAVAMVLYDVPPAQPEIIRGKDCKYKQQCRKAVEHITYKPGSVTVGYKSVDFCSYAGRRQDGGFNQQTGGD